MSPAYQAHCSALEEDNIQIRPIDYTKVYAALDDDDDDEDLDFDFDQDDDEAKKKKADQDNDEATENWWQRFEACDGTPELPPVSLWGLGNKVNC
jgi:hypothetical protein